MTFKDGMEAYVQVHVSSGWEATVKKQARVKGRTLPKIMSEGGAEEEEVALTKGKRKALSLASKGSNKRKSTADEEEGGLRGPAKWVKLEDEYNNDPD